MSTKCWPVVLVLLLPSSILAGEKENDLRKKEAEKRFTKLKEFCQERRATHVVELLAEWGAFADANQQDEVMALAADLFAEAQAAVKKEGGKPWTAAPQVGYRGVRWRADGKDFISGASAYFLNEYAPAPPTGPDEEWGLGKQVIVASRTLAASRIDFAEECIILTNAVTAEFHGLHKCIVLSSGDMTMNSTINGSVVVCRGNVQFKWGGGRSGVIVAGGKFTHTYTVASGGKKEAPELESFMYANDKTLLGVKFYSVAEDGLEAMAEKGVVTVAKVDAKKAFGIAGVKKGDVIVSINGEKVPTLHELDRLACRATVASGTAKVKVEREKKTQEIEVKLFDWAAYKPDTKK